MLTFAVICWEDCHFVNVKLQHYAVRIIAVILHVSIFLHCGHAFPAFSRYRDLDFRLKSLSRLISYTGIHIVYAHVDRPN